MYLYLGDLGRYSATTATARASNDQLGDHHKTNQDIDEDEDEEQ